MRKDPTKFRERFKRWKNGEKVYDKGTPITPSQDKLDSLLDADYQGPWGTYGYTTDDVSRRRLQRTLARNNKIADRLQAGAEAMMLGTGLILGVPTRKSTTLRSYFESKPLSLRRYYLQQYPEGRLLSTFWKEDVAPRMKIALKDEGVIRPSSSNRWFDNNFVSTRNVRVGEAPTNLRGKGYSEGVNNIVFNTNSNLWKDPNLRYEAFAHELHHSQRANLERNKLLYAGQAGEYTLAEQNALNNAYNFSDEFITKYSPLQLQEKGAVNTQTRAAISRMNGGVTGKQLDKSIDTMPDNELTDIIKNGSSYGKDFVTSPTYNTKNVRKALKYVGSVFPIPFGILFGFNKYKDGKDPGGVIQTYQNTMRRVAHQNANAWQMDPYSAYIHAMSDPTYNYFGYYLKYPESKADAKSHWTDEFKTSQHPTFSIESRYSGKIDKRYNPYGLRGGTWSKGPVELLIPSTSDKYFKMLTGYEDGKDPMRPEDEEPVSAFFRLPTVEVTPEKQYVARYDENGNPVYTSDPTLSMGYMLNPTATTRNKFMGFKPGTYGHDIANAAALMIGAPMAAVSAGPLVAEGLKLAAPYAKAGLELMGRPTSSILKGISGTQNIVPYAEAFDRSLWATTGALGMYDAGKKLYNGEGPWYENALEGGLSALMLFELSPAFREAALAIENYRYPFGKPQVPKNFLTIKPQVRTRVGDVEIDNPELYYHQSASGKANNFINTGRMRTPLEEHWLNEEELGHYIPVKLRAGIEEGYPQDPGSAMFSQGSLWYGLRSNKPDLLVTAKPMPFATKNATPLRENASLSKLEGVGSRRVTLDNIYEQGPHNPENTSAYVWEPGYGYRKVQPEEPSVAEWAMGKYIISPAISKTVPKLMSKNIGNNMFHFGPSTIIGGVAGGKLGYEGGKKAEERLGRNNTWFPGVMGMIGAAAGATLGIGTSGIFRDSIIPNLTKLKFARSITGSTLMDALARPYDFTKLAVQGKYPFTRALYANQVRNLYKVRDDALNFVLPQLPYERELPRTVGYSYKTFDPDALGEYDPIQNLVRNRLRIDPASKIVPSGYNGNLAHEYLHFIQSNYNVLDDAVPGSDYYILDPHSLMYDVYKPLSTDRIHGRNDSWIKSPNEFDSEITKRLFIANQSPFHMLNRDDVLKLAKRFNITETQAENMVRHNIAKRVMYSTEPDFSFIFKANPNDWKFSSPYANKQYISDKDIGAFRQFWSSYRKY